MKVIMASRNIKKLEELKKEVEGETLECDSSNIESVSNLCSIFCAFAFRRQ